MNAGTTRSNIKPSLKVGIVLKKDQKTGKITPGTVRRILTKSPNHPRGIKAQLEDGQVGRVKEKEQLQHGRVFDACDQKLLSGMFESSVHL
jgi:uncharacterized repeat protein (TIGR03833 family)